eukprot:3966067-Alexandrium_andersonii.AAC.1
MLKSAILQIAERAEMHRLANSRESYAGPQLDPVLLREVISSLPANRQTLARRIAMGGVYTPEFFASIGLAQDATCP